MDCFPRLSKWTPEPRQFRRQSTICLAMKWKWLFSKDGIPQSFTEYEMNWDACNELLFVYGDYGNAMNTILEPAELFAAHNGEGNRIIIGTIEIYASSSKKSIMIKSSSTERRIRIYGK